MRKIYHFHRIVMSKSITVFQIVSCSGSGEIFYTDVDREDTYGANRFDCHFGTAYKVIQIFRTKSSFCNLGTTKLVH